MFRPGTEKGQCVDCPEGEIRYLHKKHPPLCQQHLRNRKDEAKKNKKPMKINFGNGSSLGVPNFPDKITGNSDIRGMKEMLKQVSIPSGREDLFFKDRWEDPNFPRVSYVTGNPLPDQEDMRSFYFSHILKKAKSSYYRFKFFGPNLVYMTLEEHTLWEYHKYRILDDPAWAHVFALEAKLKELYIQPVMENVFGTVEKTTEYLTETRNLKVGDTVKVLYETECDKDQHDPSAGKRKCYFCQKDNGLEFTLYEDEITLNHETEKEN